MNPQPKQKPSVTITTYSCKSHNNNNKNGPFGGHAGGGNSSASNPESSTKHSIESTNLFSISYTHNFTTTTTTTTTNRNASPSLIQQQHQLKLQARNPSAALIPLNQIKGPNGSVRGHKDVVKKSLENIKSVASISQRNFTSSNLPSFMPSSQSNSLAIQHMDELHRVEYLNELIRGEQDRCVIYTTTLGVIRRTFEDSKLMRSILNLNLISYEERDVYLNQEYKHQLRMRCKSIYVPTLFVDGKFLGGIKELEAMNEEGKLLNLLAKFKMSKAAKDMCRCCGNAKFIACQQCNGSRKSTIRHFKFNSIALRCIKCDKNDGLVKCPVCCGRSKSSASSILRSIDEKSSLDGNNNESHPDMTII